MSRWVIFDQPRPCALATAIASVTAIVGMDFSPCALLRSPVSSLIARQCCENGVRRRIPRSARHVRSAARTRFGLRKSGVGPGFHLPLRRFRPINPIKRRKRNAGKRWVTTAASCDAARALLERARLTAFHHGSHLGEYFIPKVSFRPGFLGRGLHGRYPPSPVPVQGCTSHPGHNAGRHDAQAAREQAANPPAGTALAPMTRCASAPCPSLERGL